ncbi:MAG TPA: ATP-binding protein [Thermomicrobiales bacterium]|nr:ATP-binding protein [Thermomicrobiales bacterium]
MTTDRLLFMDDGFSAPAASARVAPAGAITPAPLDDPQEVLLRSATTPILDAPHINWSAMTDSAHFVQFYEADAYLLDHVGEYIAAALRAGDAGIIIATKLHRDGVEQRLQQAGLDVEAARASGQYVAHDAFETLMRFMVDGAPDADRFNEVIGEIISTAAASHSRVRAFGGMVALLVADGNYSATLELERLWNELQRHLPFSLFCAYPMDHDGGAALADLFTLINAAHTHVIPAESYNALPTADDRLRAVADLQQKARWLEAEITQRQQVEERLRVALAAERAARQEAEVAVRQRDEFLSIAAHELKTPLTSLSGQAQLALRQLRRPGPIDPDRIMRSIEVIAGQSNRLAMLLNQLLDVSRLEAGKLALAKAPTDLTTLVTGIISVIQPSTDRHLIRLTAPAELEASVDPLRFEQVITNLLDNAIKYSPQGGEIEVTISQPAPDLAELSVRDHGLGIPPEKQTRIFERFYQAHGDDHTSGLGLGLFVTRQIVDLHGGQITLEHPAGGGACFVVRVPRGM